MVMKFKADEFTDPFTALCVCITFSHTKCDMDALFISPFLLRLLNTSWIQKQAATLLGHTPNSNPPITCALAALNSQP